MFTGIVQDQVRILTKEITKQGVSFTLSRPKQEGALKEGESVLLNGICSTVVRLTKDTFGVDYMPETRKLTTVDVWKSEDLVHFEPSLRIGDTLGGHFVFGHVDTVEKIVSLETFVDDVYGQSVELVVSLSQEGKNFLVPKGSIALDGVSLTVTKVSNQSFCVSLIPHTLERTHLGSFQKGDPINIEYDMLARYVLAQKAQ